jgi:hypothetical protein
MSTAHPLHARNVRSGVLIVSDAAMLTLSDGQQSLTSHAFPIADSARLTIASCRRLLRAYQPILSGRP